MTGVVFPTTGSLLSFRMVCNQLYLDYVVIQLNLMSANIHYLGLELLVRITVCVCVAVGAELHGGGLPVLLPHVRAGEGPTREYTV